LSHVGNTFLNAFQNVILLENAAQNPQNFPPAAVQNLISLNPYQNRLKSLIYRNHLKNLLIYRNHRPGGAPRGGVQVLNECFGFNIVSVNKAYDRYYEPGIECLRLNFHVWFSSRTQEARLRSIPDSRFYIFVRR